MSEVMTEGESKTTIGNYKDKVMEQIMAKAGAGGSSSGGSSSS